MSVMILDVESMNTISCGVSRAAYRTVCDVWYSGVIRSHFDNKDIYTELERLVKSWYGMNTQSYCRRYKEPYTDYTAFIDTKKYKEFTACQLLKHLECLYYNIEPECLQMTDQMNADLKLLQGYINNLRSAIINEIPAYKDALWG